MSDHENLKDQEVNDSAPFIPPTALLALAGFGFGIALVVLLSQPTFGVIGFGALAFGVLALLMWVVLNPSHARSVVTGRAFRFGGTSILVTVVLLVALVVIYIFARNQSIRFDLTERSDFSLTEVSRQAISALGADPNVPPLEILAFYGATQAGNRSRDEALFQDYQNASGGKITYRFIDPDQNPQLASLYNILSMGTVLVGPVVDGQVDPAQAETLTFLNQQDLTNAILSAAAQGDFVAYFLTVQGNESANMSVIKQYMAEFGWTIADVSLLELTSPNGQYQLHDPNVDGEVMVIPGGTATLADDELMILSEYLDAGGQVIILAGTQLNEDGTSLALSENLNTYLYENFGMRYENEVVLDQTQAFQSPLIPVVTNLDTGSYITSNVVQPSQAVMVFEVPLSISVNPAAPADVSISQLAITSDQSYSIADAQRILAGDINQQDGDALGPFTVAASAENTRTGARLVLFGSTSPSLDAFSQLNVDNLNVMFNSLVWMTDFENFVRETTIIQDQNPQDVPVYADTQTLRNISFFTMWLLPFGILLIGVLVWWNNRERGTR